MCKNNPMIDLFEKNLAALGQRNTGLAERLSVAEIPAGAEVITARNGELSLILNGISFHSRVNPGAEARKLAETAVETARQSNKRPGFFGLGLGYHVLALAERIEEVPVVEPDHGMMRLAFTWSDFSSCMPKLCFFERPGDIESPESVLLIPHGPTVRMHRELYREWADLFDRSSGPEEETVGQWKKRLRDLPELIELVDGFDEDTVIRFDDLVRLVLRKKGPLTEGEIYILLLKELGI